MPHLFPESHRRTGCVQSSPSGVFLRCRDFDEPGANTQKRRTRVRGIGIARSVWVARPVPARHSGVGLPEPSDALPIRSGSFHSPLRNHLHVFPPGLPLQLFEQQSVLLEHGSP